MSGHSHDNTVPKAALIGAAACVIITVLLTGAVSLGLVAGPVTMEQARKTSGVTAIASRDLQFLDQPGGSVQIRDVTKGSVATTIMPGTESGFIRGVMRGLARDRMLRHLGSDQPFRLTLWSNQQLSITDMATGRNIELNGFGDTNRTAFIALLNAKPATAAVAVR
jgi:putative photosynthetic complex assembly protein